MSKPSQNQSEIAGSAYIYTIMSINFSNTSKIPQIFIH